jgi:hypothetical protein
MSAPIPRHIQRLADRIDKEIEADRKFYARFPARTCRVRRAFRAEQEMFEAIGNVGPGLQQALFVVVVLAAPGARLRASFVARRDFETDMSEAAALRLFQMLQGSFPQMAEIHQSLVEAFQEGGQ